MPVAVALAVLEQRGRWLIQLRDDIPGIVAPGCWGLFGGHLDPGEQPEQALRRELREEIAYEVAALEPWYVSHHDERVRHVYRGVLTRPLHDLQLLEGQDMALANLEELRSDRVWSLKLGEHRPLAPSLLEAVERQRAGSAQCSR
ncbi:MAG: NUDIX hydrolase [Vulcanococcus sp.]